LSAGQTQNSKEELKEMLRQTLSIFLISGLLIAILANAVVEIAVTRTDKKTRVLMGTIIEKDLFSLTVGVNNRPGEILTLTAGPAIDLTVFREGDRIIVAHDRQRTIQSIAKTG
jgi:hypothetical protein